VSVDELDPTPGRDARGHVVVAKAGESVTRGPSGSQPSFPEKTISPTRTFPKVAFAFGRGRCQRTRRIPLIDVQLVQERERVVEGFKQILVVLDHLAAHVDAKPLLVDVQLIAIEHVSEW
jgi:hypothetical protein